MANETPSRPPPLHGKCHLKFPFWFSAHLPYRLLINNFISINKIKVTDHLTQLFIRSLSTILSASTPPSWPFFSLRRINIFWSVTFYVAVWNAIFLCFLVIEKWWIINSQWPVQILSSLATNYTLCPHWNKSLKKLPPPAVREPSCLPKRQQWCFKIVCKSILSKMFAITSCHTRICAKLFGPIYGFYTPVCMFKSAISLMAFFNSFPHSTSYHINHIKLCDSSSPNIRLKSKW